MLVLWCSGYHVCFTRRRSSVRSRAGPLFCPFFHVFRQKPSKSDPNLFLARVLQYLETPQYLRKALFAKHTDLSLVGLLNPLDCPHHMRIDDPAKYREGVVLDRPTKSKKEGGSYVNAGMRKASTAPVTCPIVTYSGIVTARYQCNLKSD